MCAVLHHVTGSGRFVPGNKEINSRGSGVYTQRWKQKRRRQSYIDVEDNSDFFPDNSLVVHEQPTQTYRRSAKNAIFDDKW
jgi:hypothetical protein